MSTSNTRLPLLGQDITKALEALTQGNLLGFPTETVYGLGADAHNPNAVHKVFQAKGRPLHHPLIVHLADINQLPHFAGQIPKAAIKLAELFWPGPLTLVLPKQPGIPDCVTGGQDTVALRIPNHPLSLALLKAFGRGMVGPSANRYQGISPTSAQAVLEELGDKLSYVLDGGSSQVGIESTIVYFDEAQVCHVLRQGHILLADLVSAIGDTTQIVSAKLDTGQGLPKVPGNQARHYAPNKPVLLLKRAELLSQLKTHGDTSLKSSVFVMGFGNQPNWLEAHPQVHWESMPSDRVAYQRCLYAKLRAFDRSDFEVAWVESVPETEAWLAIADKLTRASRPQERLQNRFGLRG